MTFGSRWCFIFFLSVRDGGSRGCRLTFSVWRLTVASSSIFSKSGRGPCPSLGRSAVRFHEAVGREWPCIVAWHGSIAHFFCNLCLVLPWDPYSKRCSAETSPLRIRSLHRPSRARSPDPRATILPSSPTASTTPPRLGPRPPTTTTRFVLNYRRQ